MVYYSSMESYPQTLASHLVRTGVRVEHLVVDHKGLGGPAFEITSEAPKLWQNSLGGWFPLAEMDACVVERTEFVIFELRNLIEALQAQERRLIVERQRLLRDGVPRAEEYDVDIPPQREVNWCNRCGGDSRVCDCPKYKAIAAAVAEAVARAEAIWDSDIDSGTGQADAE